MRILLDENFPADFATLLVGHDTSNVHGHGWAGIKNGELLRRAHSVCELADLAPHIPDILQAASQVGPGRIVTVGA